MATYQAITSGQTDVESYIDTVLAGQWTNNLTAVIENDPSAPNIVNLTEESLVAITAGPAYVIALNETLFASSVQSVYVRADGLSLIVPRTGEYEVSFDMRDTSNQGSVLARIYRSSPPNYSGFVAHGAAQSEGDGNWVTKTETLSLNAGDIIVPHVDRNTGTGVEVKNLTLKSAVKLFG